MARDRRPRTVLIIRTVTFAADDPAITQFHATGGTVGASLLPAALLLTVNRNG